MDDFPASAAEPDTPPAAGIEPVEPARPAPLRAALRLGQPQSQEWAQVFAAMDALRHTLDVNNVLTRHPAVAHDLVVLLAAFEAVRGDALFEAYWRAQLDRLITLNPDIKKPSVPTIERSAGGSVYIYQSLNASPRGG